MRLDTKKAPDGLAVSSLNYKNELKYLIDYDGDSH